MPALATPRCAKRLSAGVAAYHNEDSGRLVVAELSDSLPAAIVGPANALFITIRSGWRAAAYVGPNRADRGFSSHEAAIRSNRVS